MSTLSIAQLAALDAQAGWPAAQIPTFVAVQEAESGGDPAAMGDVTLEDRTWGPSVGLSQIRSLWSERGTGATRDELANVDPLTNARHALEVAGGGANLSPWSTYTSGAYRTYLPQVQAELAGGYDTTAPALDGTTPTLDVAHVGPIPIPDPFGLFQGLQKGTVHLVFTALGVLVGGALIVVGAGRASGHPVTQVIGNTASTAAEVAPMVAA